MNYKKFPMVVTVWAGIIYVICGVLWALIPETLLQIARPVVHGLALETMPQVTLSGLVVGLIEWLVLAYLLALLFVFLWKNLAK